VRERRASPATVPALFIRIVGGPSWEREDWLVSCGGGGTVA
jgi:hypothetical protein